MRRRLFWWEVGGFAAVAVLGTLLHFTYDWSGKWVVAASFSAVNESTWEHMKLLFMPLFLVTVVQVCFLGRTYANFLAVRACSALVGLALIPTLFYTYTGILGYHLMWADIAVFLLADLGMFLLDFRLLSSGRRGALWEQIAGLLVLWGLAFLFVWFTFRPPVLGLFLDPVTMTYGLPQ